MTEPRAPRLDGQEEEEVTLRDLEEGSLWNLSITCALPSVREERELMTSGHACKPPSAQPQVVQCLLMRFSGGLLKIIKKQFLHTQY